MNRLTPAVRAALATGILAVAACGGGGAASTGSPAIAAIASGEAQATVPSPTVGAPSMSPGASSAEPTAAGSTGAIPVPDTCALVTPAEIGVVVGMVVKAGQDVTAETGWSSACAWVQSVGAGQAPYNVNVKALAAGTLVAFKSMAGAHSLASVGDEAYVFDDGRQIAMRLGQLIVVVGGARGIDGHGVPASGVEALARLVAERIRS